jgi:hypothetical protein
VLSTELKRVESTDDIHDLVVKDEIADPLILHSSSRSKIEDSNLKRDSVFQ